MKHKFKENKVNYLKTIKTIYQDLFITIWKNHQKDYLIKDARNDRSWEILRGAVKNPFQLH